MLCLLIVFFSVCDLCFVFCVFVLGCCCVLLFVVLCVVFVVSFLCFCCVYVCFVLCDVYVLLSLFVSVV